MSFPRKGLVACKDSGKKDYLRMFPVLVNANQAYFKNALVALDTLGNVINVTASTVSPCIGVIYDLLLAPNNDLDPPRPLTFNQPTRGPYLTSGQTGFALVNTDPDQLYVIQFDSTASAGLIGKNVNVSAAAGGAGNTLTGISSQNARAAFVAVASERQLQIVDYLAPNEKVTGRGEKAVGSGIVVRLNGSQLAGGAKTGI